MNKKNKPTTEKTAEKIIRLRNCSGMKFRNGNDTEETQTQWHGNDNK